MLHAKVQHGFEDLGGNTKEPTLKFYIQLTKKLIFNKYIPGKKKYDEKTLCDRKKTRVRTFELILLPKYTQFFGAEIVTATAPYNQWRYVCRKKRVRNFYVCNLGFIRCNSCFVDNCAHNENA